MRSDLFVGLIRWIESHGSQTPSTPISHLVNMIGQLIVREEDFGATCRRAPNGAPNFFTLSSNPSGRYKKAVERLNIRPGEFKDK